MSKIPLIATLFLSLPSFISRTNVIIIVLCCTYILCYCLLLQLLSYYCKSRISLLFPFSDVIWMTNSKKYIASHVLFFVFSNPMLKMFLFTSNMLLRQSYSFPEQLLSCLHSQNEWKLFFFGLIVFYGHEIALCIFTASEVVEQQGGR
jgi:hypothetical protein